MELGWRFGWVEVRLGLGWVALEPGLVALDWVEIGVTESQT